jgi:hypothetical protein
MARAKGNRFTIYDMMEQKGVFDENPANVNARDDEGLSIYQKQDFPKMYYHPEGKTRVTVPAEEVATPFGPKRVGEKSEIIWILAKNQKEADLLEKKGWHDHPAKAIHAGGGEAPPISSAQQISDLETKLKQMERELTEARKIRAQDPVTEEDENPLEETEEDTPAFSL